MNKPRRTAPSEQGRTWPAQLCPEVCLSCHIAGRHVFADIYPVQMEHGS
jgi:hypothetical protein